MPRKNNRQGAGSKKRRTKRRNQRRRALNRRLDEESVISMAGIGGCLKPMIRRHKRDDLLGEALHHKIIEHDNEDIQQFKTIDGRASCTYVVIDRDSRDIAFVVKVNLYKDMSDTERSRYQELFTYFNTDQTIKGHQLLKNSAAKTGGGHMNAVGWRPGYSTGVNMANYTSGHNPNFSPAQIQQHENRLSGIHSAIADSFRSLSSLIHNNQNAELRQLGTLAAGMPFGTDGQGLDGCFCSNIAYTYGGFHNVVHNDNDASSYTYGMFGRTKRGTGILTSQSEAVSGTGISDTTKGFSFLVIPYHIRVLLAEIDGVVELIWRGPLDGHCTTTGVRAPGFDRMAFTCQISNNLVARAKRHSTQYAPDHHLTHVDYTGTHNTGDT
ncbi:hypothetical protein BJ508DRAFT_320692 [Ascobolus immersus RN42]|uniref:Tet-like 2OG-Fe(II) oxygenase domain-containing protein n=1 Tax=Ascobolus immersus RN42 TaxID=1160509 RepID=A0A3N4IPK9_ASCIM|nr:hypothetical protein BJ508DRAFT_320692 [Ascobolus immersus RN42]